MALPLEPTFGSSAVHEHNRRAWDALARARDRFSKPATDGELSDAVESVEEAGWFEGPLTGRRFLCLGSGGGRQSARYAAAGAHVTVVDISGEMLALDRAVATERRLDIRLVQASMDDLSALKPASFDIVCQPVSTCYVPDISAAYCEVARVLVNRGLYISQHKQPTSLQTGVQPSQCGYELVEPYFRTGPLPPVAGSRHREEGTFEFLHRWEEIVGGMCRAGFVVEDMIEPAHGRNDARVEALRTAVSSCHPTFASKLAAWHVRSQPNFAHFTT